MQRVSKSLRLVLLSSCFAGAAAAEPQDCASILAGNPSAPTGVYAISPNGSDVFDAYCDMDTDGGGWTLIESSSRTFGESTLSDQPFYVNAPHSENDPAGSRLTLYRLSYGRMLDLHAISDELRATTDFGASDDKLLFTLGYLIDDPFFSPFTSTLVPVDYASIRGFVVVDGSIQMWNDFFHHFHVDSSSFSGDSPWAPTAVFSEDNFGHYSNINTLFTGTATAASTTEWWLRQLDAEPPPFVAPSLGPIAAGVLVVMLLSTAGVLRAQRRPESAA